MAEIGESAKEGLLALAVGTGLQVMAAMFSEDAERLCGPEGRHNPNRAAGEVSAASIASGGTSVAVSSASADMIGLISAENPGRQLGLGKPMPPRGLLTPR